MLIYNTSFHVTGESLVSKFLQYMRDEYLPRVLAGGRLRNPRFVRLLTPVGDDVFAYSLMVETATVAELKAWKQADGDRLAADFSARFGERVLMFSTTMRVVDL